MALADNGNGLSAADVAAVVGNNGGAFVKRHMIDGLYSMMGDADSEAERGAFQDCINKIKG